MSHRIALFKQIKTVLFGLKSLYKNLLPTDFERRWERIGGSKGQIIFQKIRRGN